MKNNIGFIPKSYPIQPDYYKRIFDQWTAVFLTYEDNEYHIQLCIDFLAGGDEAKHVEILRQHETHRTQLNGIEYPSIKKAYNRLLPILQKENFAHETLKALEL